MTWKSDLIALAGIGMGTAFGIALTTTVMDFDHDAHFDHQVHVHVERVDHGIEVDIEGDDSRWVHIDEAEGDNGRRIEIEKEIRIRRTVEGESENEFVISSGPQVDVMVEEDRGSRVRIRGSSAVSEGEQPLIYVDGVRVEDRGYLDSLHPSVIDRIEIVKGEAAQALYGDEAAGGVIQIFTKKDEEEGDTEGR